MKHSCLVFVFFSAVNSPGVTCVLLLLYKPQTDRVERHRFTVWDFPSCETTILWASKMTNFEGTRVSELNAKLKRKPHSFHRALCVCARVCLCSVTYQKPPFCHVQWSITMQVIINHVQFTPGDWLSCAETPSYQPLRVARRRYSLVVSSSPSSDSWLMSWTNPSARSWSQVSIHFIVHFDLQYFRCLIELSPEISSEETTKHVFHRSWVGVCRLPRGADQNALGSVLECDLLLHAFHHIFGYHGELLLVSCLFFNGAAGKDAQCSMLNVFEWCWLCGFFFWIVSSHGNDLNSKLHSPFMSLQFATFETAITALVDDFPQLFRKRRIQLTVSVAVLMFLLGLPQCTQVRSLLLVVFGYPVNLPSTAASRSQKGLSPNNQSYFSRLRYDTGKIFWNYPVQNQVPVPFFACVVNPYRFCIKIPVLDIWFWHILCRREFTFWLFSIGTSAPFLRCLLRCLRSWSSAGCMVGRSETYKRFTIDNIKKKKGWTKRCFIVACFLYHRLQQLGRRHQGYVGIQTSLVLASHLDGPGALRCTGKNCRTNSDILWQKNFMSFVACSEKKLQNQFDKSWRAVCCFRCTETFVSPVIATEFQFIISFNAAIYTPVTYGDYVYPQWAELMGWGTSLASIICIPIGFIIVFHQKVGWKVRVHVFACLDKAKFAHDRTHAHDTRCVCWWLQKVSELTRNPVQTWRKLTSPSSDWCPAEQRQSRKQPALQTEVLCTTLTSVFVVPVCMQLQGQVEIFCYMWQILMLIIAPIVFPWFVCRSNTSSSWTNKQSLETRKCKMFFSKTTRLPSPWRNELMNLRRQRCFQRGCLVCAPFSILSLGQVGRETCLPFNPRRKFPPKCHTIRCVIFASSIFWKLKWRAPWLGPWSRPDRSPCTPVWRFLACLQCSTFSCFWWGQGNFSNTRTQQIKLPWAWTLEPFPRWIWCHRHEGNEEPSAP